MRHYITLLVLWKFLLVGLCAKGLAQPPESYNPPVRFGHAVGHHSFDGHVQQNYPDQDADYELANRVKELEAYVNDQKKKAEDAKQKAAEEKCKAECPEWEEANDGWTHKIGGRILGDTVGWAKGDQIPGSVNYFEFRSIRLKLSGTGWGVFDYKLQFDLEPEVADTIFGAVVSRFGSVGMKDMYVAVNEMPILRRVQIGHFKVPFSLQQLTSRRDITFMERNPMGDPGGFTPGREVGIASYGYTNDERVTWAYGAFFDGISETAKEQIDDKQGLLMAGRMTWTPIYDESSGRYTVHLGMGGLYTHTQDDSGRFRQRPEIHEGPRLIDTGNIAAPDYSSFNPELGIYFGPFSLQSEAYWTNVNTAAGGDIDLYGGYVQGSWFLTGEHRTYDRKKGIRSDVKPFENFWIVPGCFGLGAWEVAARWSWVDFTNSPNGSRYNSLNMALNWYWTERLRVQMNWIQPFTAGAPFGATYSSILGMRIGAWF